MMLVKRSVKQVLSIGLLFAAVSCGEVKEEAEKVAEPIVESVTAEAEEMATAMNTDSIVMAIDAMRAEVEGNLAVPVKIMTTDLKEKIKQKWSEIHFYAENENIVRIKTYPHATISNRTEEFYVNNGELALVVVEDNGQGERGKSEEEIDKKYYFSADKMIKEMHSENESEYSVRESDAEELMSEFKEYLDIYQNR